MKKAKLLLLACTLLFLCACGAGAEIPRLTDPDTNWDNITQITLYADGYYGRSMDEPLVITDAAAIEELTDALLNTRAYRTVSPEKVLEGLNGLWVDFGNGVVLGMYADRNYGSFCSSPGENGSPCYKLPPKLWRMTNELLEQAQ